MYITVPKPHKSFPSDPIPGQMIIFPTGKVRLYAYVKANDSHVGEYCWVSCPDSDYDTCVRYYEVERLLAAKADKS